MSWSDLGIPEPSDSPEPREPAPREPRGEVPAPPPKEPKPPRPPREPRPAKPPKPPREPRPAREPRVPREPREPREPRGPRGPREPGSRTPLILGIIAGILFAAVLVTLAIALNRPGAPAPTGATATEAPTAQPSASATAPEETDEPVSLTFSGPGFALLDAQQEPVFTFGWRDDVAGAVSALTEAFGAAPTTRVEPGNGSTYPDYTVYQWDGFMLFDMVDTAGLPRAGYTQPTYALFSRNEIGGIALTAERGLQIGTPIAQVRAAGPDAETPRGNVGSIRFTFDGARSGTASGALQYSSFADTDGSVVKTILYYFAPN